MTRVVPIKLAQSPLDEECTRHSERSARWMAAMNHDGVDAATGAAGLHSAEGATDNLILLGNRT